MGTIALVDGRNTAYRTVFAAQGNEDFAKYHPFALWLKFSRDWIGKYMPDAVHVFWDANKKTLWRNQLLAEYKGQRAAALERHGFDVGAEIGKLEGAANSVLPAMGVRQFQRDGQEADDLIYAACRILVPNKVVVISSDKDFVQIPWLMPHVVCYDPIRKTELQPPSHSPILQKCLMGDKSDNVPGYPSIGIVRSANMANDPAALQAFLKARGPSVFQRNMALLDLSMNPHRMANELYVMRKLAEEMAFNRDAILGLIGSLRIRGLAGDYAQYVLPYKLMIENAKTHVPKIEGDANVDGS